MSKTLEKISVIPQDDPAPLAPVTPMDMLNRAVSSGADLDMIEKLMNLQERWQANQARTAFENALAEVGKEIPVIVKNATGHNNKKYADFAAIAKAVDPILGRHGLRYRFRTTQGDKISVTCILYGHGHHEETTLTAPADASGSKNAIQAIGSTLTYLQRYSLVQMLGLAAAADDDGKSAVGADGTISLEQVETLVALADEVGADKEAFCRYFRVAGFADIPSKDFDRAIAALNKKRSTSR